MFPALPLTTDDQRTATLATGRQVEGDAHDQQIGIHCQAWYTQAWGLFTFTTCLEERAPLLRVHFAFGGGATMTASAVEAAVDH